MKNFFTSPCCFAFKIVLIFFFFFSDGTLSIASTVKSINALYSNGQTFVTWIKPVGGGQTYRVYKKKASLGNFTAGDFGVNSPYYLGTVTNTSSKNDRYSDILDIKKYFKLPDGTQLVGKYGLFVVTTNQSAKFTYAVMVVANGIEDVTLLASKNYITTNHRVNETVANPAPVYQETITLVVNQLTRVAKVYTLFASKIQNPNLPPFTNIPTFYFNLAVVDAAPGKPCVVRFHGGGGSFYDAISDEDPTLAQLSIDEWFPDLDNPATIETEEINASFYIGYHSDIDVYSTNNNPLPTSGTVGLYSYHRMEYLLNWAIATFHLDANRVYARGTSMGAVGAFNACMLMPDKFAAAILGSPKYNFRDTADFNFYPNGPCAWNHGEQPREGNDFCRGPVSANLATTYHLAHPEHDYHIYDIMNGSFMQGENRLKSLPIIFAINGRFDGTMGWQEKIGYYSNLEADKAGGFYFWDTRDHGDSVYFTNFKWKTWSRDFLRYRLNLSYPAFSNCQSYFADSLKYVNRGNGNNFDGEPDGTINGFLDWKDSSIVDQPNDWAIDIDMSSGLDYLQYDTSVGSVTYPFTPPDSCFTKVTLRRLQQFGNFSTGTLLYYKVSAHKNYFSTYQGQFIDTVFTQYGQLNYSTSGLITVSGIKVYKGKLTHIEVSTQPILKTGSEVPMFSEIYDAAFQTVSIQLPENFLQHDEAKVYNVLGQQLSSFKVASTYIRVSVGDLPNGQYFIVFSGNAAVDLRARFEKY